MLKYETYYVMYLVSLFYIKYGVEVLSIETVLNIVKRISRDNKRICLNVKMHDRNSYYITRNII